MPVKDELVDLEQQFWRAGGDADFYRRRFAEDGQCVFAFGVLDKPATVSSMESSQPWSSFELRDVTTLDVASGVAALTYAVHATRGNDEYEAIVSSVYAHRHGAWELVVHHQTPKARPRQQ